MVLFIAVLLALMRCTAALNVCGLSIPHARDSPASRALNEMESDDSAGWPKSFPYSDSDLKPIMAGNDGLFYLIPKFVQHAGEECRECASLRGRFVRAPCTLKPEAPKPRAPTLTPAPLRLLQLSPDSTRLRFPTMVTVKSWICAAHGPRIIPLAGSGSVALLWGSIRSSCSQTRVRPSFVCRTSTKIQHCRSRTRASIV